MSIEQGSLGPTALALPPLPNQPHAYRMDGGVYVDRESFLEWHEAHSARERILLARVAELESALSDAVALYGKPGGPWNIPVDPGGWLERARAAIDAARGAK